MQLIVLEKKGVRVFAIQKEGTFTNLWVEERHRKKPLQGDIILGVVNKVVHGKNAAFISLGSGKPGLLNGEDTIVAQKKKTVGETPPAVSDVIEEGQAILVQVMHEGYDRKGPIVTELVQLPSETLVYMPYAGYSAVAKAISKREEFLTIAEEHCIGDEGIIFRSSAREVSKDQLVEDLTNQRKVWTSILENVKDVRPPATVVTANDTYDKVDNYFPIARMDKVITNSSGVAKELEQRWIDLKLIQVEANHRSLQQLDEKLDELSNPTVKIGKASIHIETTRALTAIDIDSGGADYGSIEETHKKVNEAAVMKIVEQLNLRNLGGTIMIDVLTMSESEKSKFLQYINEALSGDPRIIVGGYTHFGLVELRRKKQGLPLHKLLT
ncbi:ribonuclease E/G [Guptibacillus algicola]|uniref:ribonuclease E/G n=1 Tax=Guptibacillus algicola TaxID=225844 RepID=UPI001CD397A5|nr:ribonuclease E/G [Alkalihalobacillus algicola]MCA0986208.1 ribonuclease E/G [Alkalihalobacillus algicola]